MLAAFFEWLLWLAAFVYCLVKVYQKADHWSVRVLAVVMAILFILLRQVMSIYLFSVQSTNIPGHQLDLSSGDDRDTADAQPNHSIIPCSCSLVLSVVCILLVFYSPYRSMAHLCVPTCHQLSWKDEKD